MGPGVLGNKKNKVNTSSEISDGDQLCDLQSAFALCWIERTAMFKVRRDGLHIG